MLTHHGQLLPKQGCYNITFQSGSFESGATENAPEMMKTLLSVIGNEDCIAADQTSKDECTDMATSVLAVPLTPPLSTAKAGSPSGDRPHSALSTLRSGKCSSSSTESCTYEKSGLIPDVIHLSFPGARRNHPSSIHLQCKKNASADEKRPPAWQKCFRSQAHPGYDRQRSHSSQTPTQT
ncbi:hypothetical protein WISP_146995 [Willisornis vidua]|uniref:Uncharacterized protein n=1 Tax=Willisornis vidua TaxID=1566151 RepID=A0ABQ9CQX8_9PASS|nr:hypothetical protein WISP_146995 [Willisornis vidua]